MATSSIILPSKRLYLFKITPTFYKQVINIRKSVISIKDILKKDSKNKKPKTKPIKPFNSNLLKKSKDTVENLSSIVPDLGIKDKLLRFIRYIFLGNLLPKLIKYSAILNPIVGLIGAASQFVYQLTGNIFKGLVNAIDFGYKAANKTRRFLNEITGFKFEKEFDKVEDNLKLFINGAIIAGGVLATAGIKLPKKFGPGKLITKALKPITKGIRRGVIKAVGVGAYKTVGKFFKFGKIFARVPIIGGLIDFILSVATGEKVGRAAARAVGSTIGAALGTLIPIPFAGTLLGGVLGDIVGGALYDTLESQFSRPKPKKLKSGGLITRNGKPINTKIRRSIPSKKVKKLQTRKSGVAKTYAGKDIGGEKKITELFNDQKDPTIKSPLRSLKTTSKLLKSIPMFGGLMGASVDIALGQKPDPNVYKTFIDNFNALVQNNANEQVSKSLGSVRSSIMSMNTGGLVPRTMAVTPTINAADLAHTISSTFAMILNQKTGEIFQNIIKELSLKSPAGGGFGGGDSSGTSGGYEPPSGLERDIYDYLISKGLSDAHALGIMANISRESSFRVDAKEPGGPGIGLFQYSDSSRKSKFLNSVSNWETNWKGQIDYALKEGVAPEYLKMKFNSPEEAADWWMKKWERPAEYIQNYTGPKYHRKYLSGIKLKPGGGLMDSTFTNVDENKLRKAGFGIGQGLGAGRNHGGRDITIESGFPLKAISDGVVVDDDFQAGGWGNFIVFKDNKGIYHLYAHLSRRGKRGRVKKGDIIGLTGNTGGSRGPHLHWEAGTEWDGYEIKNRFDPITRYSAKAPFLTKKDSKPSEEETKNIGGIIYKKQPDGKWKSQGGFESSPEIISDEDMKVKIREQEKNRFKSSINSNINSQNIAKYTTYDTPQDTVILARQTIFVESPMVI